MIDRRFLNVGLTVSGIANTPEANPTAGTQYIIGNNPSGAFAGKAINSLARYDGTNWHFSPPKSGGFEVLNAATGELLQFNGSVWSPVATLGGGDATIAPVLDIIKTGTTLPQSATEGDKFLDTETADIYTATAEDTWNSGSATASGARYASLTDHKVYESDGSELTVFILPVGGMFLNKKNNNIYVYDGTNFVEINASGSGSDLSTGKIQTVDSIVVGLETASQQVSMSNLKDTNGRPCIVHEDGSMYLGGYTFDHFPYYFGITTQDDYWDNNRTFAAFLDGKFYFCDPDNDIITSVDIEDGELFYNKGDSAFYTYDATNHNFIKLTTGTYVVDYITNNLTSSSVYHVLRNVYNKIEVVGTQFYNGDIIHLETDSFVALNSIYSNDVCIFNHEAIMQTVLIDGDIVYCKFDGCTYILKNKIFIKQIQGDIPPIVDFVTTVGDHPKNPQVGKKYLMIDTSIWLFRYRSANEEDYEELTLSSGIYVSSNEKRVYIYNSSIEYIEYYYDLPIGVPFFNNGDHKLYIYNGTDIIEMSSGSGGDEVVTETHTLIASEITNKSITLANSVKSGKENQVLLFVAGLVQLAGTDFIVSGNTISWNAKGLESRPVVAGDILVIQYTKA